MDWCFAGEVGLSGEVRAVKRIAQRIIEADRLGFKKICIPFQNSCDYKSWKSFNRNCSVQEPSRASEPGIIDLIKGDYTNSK